MLRIRNFALIFLACVSGCSLFESVETKEYAMTWKVDRDQNKFNQTNESNEKNECSDEIHFLSWSSKFFFFTFSQSEKIESFFFCGSSPSFISSLAIMIRLSERQITRSGKSTLSLLHLKNGTLQSTLCQAQPDENHKREKLRITAMVLRNFIAPSSERRPIFLPIFSARLFCGLFFNSHRSDCWV